MPSRSQVQEDANHAALDPAHEIKLLIHTLHMRFPEHSQEEIRHAIEVSKASLTANATSTSIIALASNFLRN